MLEPGAVGQDAPAVAKTKEPEVKEIPTTPPVPLVRVPPVYPRRLRSAGVTGQVTVRFVIDERGRVESPEVVSSTNSGFNQAALDCVKKWKFKPAQKAGKAVSISIRVPIVFKLSD